MRRKIRIRPSSAAIAAGLALALTGCGGGERTSAPPPQLPSALAKNLAARSDRVAELLATGDRCGARASAARLAAAVVAAINAGRVPAPFQEELGGAAAALAARITCVPDAPQAAQRSDGATPARNRKREDGGGQTSRTGPTPLLQGGTPGEDAQGLADWLRENAAR